MIQKIIKFIQDAGALALAQQKDTDFFKSELKTDTVYSAVTDADMAITKMFREFVDCEFGDLDYIIVDEETVEELGHDPVTEIKKHEYAFVIDPIDGTLTYTSKLPYWGIIIGVFKNGKPYVGAVYLPGLNTLIYADENAAYVVENGEMKELKPLSDTTESPPLLILNTFIIRRNPNLNFKEIQPVQFYSSAVNLLYMALNRTRGYWFAVHMWDIAGFLPIFKHVGVEVRGMNDGKEFSIFDSDTYKSENLMVRQLYIASRPKYYDWMKNITTEEGKGNP